MSRAVASFADFENIEEAEFEDEVLLVGSGGTGTRLVDMGEEDLCFGHKTITAGRRGRLSCRPLRERPEVRPSRPVDPRDRPSCGRRP